MTIRSIDTTLSYVEGTLELSKPHIDVRSKTWGRIAKVAAATLRDGGTQVRSSASSKVRLWPKINPCSRKEVRKVATLSG
jgi:hypothetical protein